MIASLVLAAGCAVDPPATPDEASTTTQDVETCKPAGAVSDAPSFPACVHAIGTLDDCCDEFAHTVCDSRFHSFWVCD
jgi:hypothetical protein